MRFQQNKATCILLLKSLVNQLWSRRLWSNIWPCAFLVTPSR